MQLVDRPVSLLPCLHTFCNGCFFEYWRTIDFEQNEDFSCPNCRSKCSYVTPNATLDAIAAKVRSSDPSFANREDTLTGSGKAQILVKELTPLRKMQRSLIPRRSSELNHLLGFNNRNSG